MSSIAQIEENMRYAAEFKSLTSNELDIYQNVVAVFKESFKIPCTGCNYCLPCPKGINIPARFSAYNASYAQGRFTGIFIYLTGIGVLSDNPIMARSCTACGKCEKECPQHIPIVQDMKKVARKFESLPMRGLLKVLRRVMR